MVAARRAGDDALAAQLSQEKQKLKAIGWCIWPGCGLRVGTRGKYYVARYCQMHGVQSRFHQKRLWG